MDDLIGFHLVIFAPIFHRQMGIAVVRSSVVVMTFKQREREKRFGLKVKGSGTVNHRIIPTYIPSGCIVCKWILL